MNPDCAPDLVESFDALKLASQNNMRTLEQKLMAKQNAGLRKVSSIILKFLSLILIRDIDALLSTIKYLVHVQTLVLPKTPI